MAVVVRDKPGVPDTEKGVLVVRNINPGLVPHPPGIDSDITFQDPGPLVGGPDNLSMNTRQLRDNPSDLRVDPDPPWPSSFNSHRAVKNRIRRVSHRRGACTTVHLRP